MLIIPTSLMSIMLTALQRQEPFFSMDVTHVITTRSIPSERPQTQETTEPEVEEREPREQPTTINPSLLDRNTAARRKLLFEFRNVPSRPQQINDPTKPSKGMRNNDVLHKAREMGKKIWTLDKFQTMVSVLLETESQSSYSSKASSRTQGQAKGGNENNLLQLLQHERMNGPTDRDMSASTRELTYFKGPHIYVFDMEERHKPMMVREYAKVANKADGDWPQFRSVGNGRCPFVEEDPQEREYRKLREQREQRQQREQEKARVAAAKKEAMPSAKKQEAVTKPVTGKRTLAEMEDGHNKAPAPSTSLMNPAKAALSKQASQNAFTSRTEGGRVFHGEPVASGLQPSNVTSAIRSQMISSQAGVSAIKAGTSKELYGLQRKVLQKAAPTSQETASQRPSVDGTSSRLTTLSRQTSKSAQPQEEGGQKATESKEKRTQPQAMKSKKDMKPGYCENCQDKFRDFDEVCSAGNGFGNLGLTGGQHILSRKHRRFAENTDNWGELDALLAKLKRLPKDFYMDEGYEQ